MYFVLLILLAGTGMYNEIKAETSDELCRKNGIESCIPYYSTSSRMLSGLGAIVALIGGMLGKFPWILGGLLATVVFTLPYLKKANDDMHMIKKYGGNLSSKFFTYSPVWVYGRIVLLGMGKWMHIVMICTLIGIPLYNMLKQVSVNIDKLNEQIALRNEYEAMKAKER